MKRKLSLALSSLLLMGLLTGCGPSKERVNEFDEQTTSTTVVSSTQESEKDNLAQEQAELVDFRVALGAFGPTRFEPEIKSYVLTPTDPDTVAGIENIMKGTQDKGSWIELVNSVIDANKTMNERLGGGYSIVLENPYETGQMILAVKNGEVIHDGVAEAGGFTY